MAKKGKKGGRTPSEMKVCIFSLPISLVERIDHHLDWIKENRPGLAASRSDLVRRFLLEGIEHAEREQALDSEVV